MSEHTLNIDTNDSNLPNQSFFAWLKSQTALFITQLLGWAGAIYVLAAVPYYLKPVKDVPEIFNPKNVQEFIIYAHIPFLLLFIVTLLNILDSNSPGSYRSRIVYRRIFNKELGGAQLRKGRIQLQKFKLYFLYFWLLMLVLYSSFAFQINSKSSDKFPKKAELSERIKKLNELNIADPENPKKLANPEKLKDEIRQIKGSAEDGKITEAINKLKDQRKETKYAEGMTKIRQISTYESPETNVPKLQEAYWLITEKIKIGGSWGDAFYDKIFEFFIFAANNFSLLFIFWCFTVLTIPWHTKKYTVRAKKIRNIATIIMIAVTAIFPIFLFLSKSDGGYYEEDVKTNIILADALSGLINAVVVALFIARLDSKLIGLPSYLISILYGYSAIQPLFVVFEQPGEIPQILKAFVLVVVFIFKIYFFLIIIYAMQTGRMLDYLVCFPKLFGRVDSIFANQFQIEIQKEKDEYVFLIKNKHYLVYSGAEHFKTKDECEAAIREAREIMKERKNYKPEESFGTHTINVHRSVKLPVKICSSVDLKSQDEVNDLITESIVNVPYCKVVKQKTIEFNQNADYHKR